MITNMEKNIQKDNTRVLILTGSSIPSEMEKIIGELPSGLIPINGVPVIFRTINNLISKISVVGNILVGNKVGEGVFGVSFKMKGLPGEVKTTVNPVKTLTPRFITRALEKMKRSN